MKNVIIILSVFVLIVGGCGQAKKRQTGATGETAQEILSSVKDTVHSRQTIAVNNTAEDTVRYQIGGKLCGLNFNPSDSITVINRVYRDSDKWGSYREYQFILHNRYSSAHRYFSTSYFDSVYNSYMADSSYLSWYDNHLKPRLDSVQSRYIAPEIKDFNGYWVYLTEHNGDYYLDEVWGFRSFAFRITDSLFIEGSWQDGPYHYKIVEATSTSENAISILYDRRTEPVIIELLDKLREIYRFVDPSWRVSFIAPARAIHNFEIIQYTNTTGDAIH